MSAKNPEKAAAKAAGLTTYNGSPCPLGHGTLRRVASGCCAECHRIKRRASYYRNPQQREKAREDMRARRREDPRGVRRKSIVARMQKQYGISAEDYARWFKSQNGRCAICEREMISRLDDSRPLDRGTGRVPNAVARVDHCHLTNAVRGLLCSNCNILLGKAGDSIKILLNAVGYLRANATQQAQPAATR